MRKRSFLLLFLGLFFGLASHAANYFLVVPIQGKKAVAPDISVSLASAELPQAQVGQAYSYDLKPLLSVTGDPGYTGAGVNWSVSSGALPPGLSLDSNGSILGAPSQLGAFSFSAKAAYQAAVGENIFQLNVQGLASTWNPSDKFPNYLVLSDGNLRVATTGGGAPTASQYASLRASSFKTSGKWYWEVQVFNGAPGWSIVPCGVATATASLNGAIGYDLAGAAGVLVSPGSTPAIYGCAADLDTRTLRVYRNGTFYRATTIPDGSLAAAQSLYNLDVFLGNFGGTPFAYAVPVGHSAYN